MWGPIMLGPGPGPPQQCYLSPQCCPVSRSKWSLQRNSTILMTQKDWRSPLQPGERPGEGPSEGPGERAGEGLGEGQVKD